VVCKPFAGVARCPEFVVDIHPAVKRNAASVSEPGADRGPRAGSPRGMVDAMGSSIQVALRSGRYRSPF
jgi:hypothetical protein